MKYIAFQVLPRLNWGIVFIHLAADDFPCGLHLQGHVVFLRLNPWESLIPLALKGMLGQTLGSLPVS